MLLAAGLLALAAGFAPLHAAEMDTNVPTVAQTGKTTLDQTWRNVRNGEAGIVTGQPAARGVLIQSEGEAWRAFRNGKLALFGGLAIIGVTLAIAVFYFWRGKIRMEGGPSGKLILRFKTIERIGHWTTAGSFLVLAFTGLIMLFGRWIVIPVLGHAVFSWLAAFGKWLHNIGGFIFMAGLTIILVLWAKDNLWDRYDWNWIKGGGGLLKAGVHPPAAKFNFGQKTQYWMVILVGLLVSFTGVNLIFPYSVFELHGMQILHIVHAAAAIVMILFMLGHIYIGTIGMEGASSAMTSGYVDLEWAREHHAVWVAEEEAKTTPPDWIVHGMKTREGQ
ncbi:MAG: formate dehydrogenase subunit gamma [Rhodospirillaceae bacterium]|nr:formate dehydrogenase subunit gamma [Rhodospirillales bacterium]